MNYRIDLLADGVMSRQFCLGWDSKKLSEKSGVAQNVIQKLEIEDELPCEEDIQKLAKVLNFNPETFKA